MNLISGNTAILYFSRTPKSESAVRNIHGDKNKNRNIVRLLFESVKNKLESTGLPVFHYDEYKQIGDNFSERLTNSIDDLYNKGFKNVITVGSDSPEVLDIDFLQIVSEVENGNTVLGPTQKGGIYLIASPFESWDKKEFKKIPWNTSRVLESLKLLFPKCIVKSELTEVHNYSDIVAVLTKRVDNEFVIQAKKILRSYLDLPDYSDVHHTTEILLIKLERGPPVPVFLTT